MQETLKSRHGRTLILPTLEEDAAIQAAALADPDAPVLSDAQWESIVESKKRGRPLAEAPKQLISLRLDADVIAGFRALGKGWQTRANEALREWLKTRQAA